MANKSDNIYQKKLSQVSNFEFDQQVADVFQDMISRSVPGYTQIIDLLPTLSRQFSINGANYYDLGCSLGAGVVALAQGLRGTSANIVGVDNSDAMVERAIDKLNLLETPDKMSVSIECADILEYGLEDAAMVLMNFTLQFIDPKDRMTVINNIYGSLKPGGVLVLSEKLRFSDQATNQLYIDIYHQYKADQGYSELEISQKRDAIENVLIPEDLATHVTRLSDSGFKTITPWIQNLQFVSLLAIK
jgi:tRNA (cmo5U34)-methyltransferase